MAFDISCQIVFPNCIPTYDATNNEQEGRAEGLINNFPKVDQLPYKVIKVQNVSAQYRISKSEEALSR